MVAQARAVAMVAHDAGLRAGSGCGGALGTVRWPVDGLSGLAHRLSFFIYSINRGGQATASENSSFIVTFGPR